MDTASSKAGLRADDRHDALLGAHADLVDGDDVQRVGHGHHEAAVVVEAERHEPAAHDEVARQQAEGAGLGRGLREVDHADVHLAGHRGDDVLLADQALARRGPRRGARRRRSGGSRAPSSCSCVTRPLATSRAPSLRRPLVRCLRPLTSASSLGRRSSGENGLVTNSEAPARCACSKVAKSLADESTSTRRAAQRGVAGA